MADTPETKQAAEANEAAIRDAFARSDVPKLYANSFGVVLTNADIVVIFQRFGTNPVAVVNLSYTLAKTLAQRLGRAVQEFESKINQDILTTDRIDEAFKTPEGVVKTKTDEIH